MGVERYLLGEERHVTTVHQHAIVLARPVAEVTAGFALALQLPMRGLVGSVGAVIVLVILLDALVRIAHWRTHWFVITDQRVLLVSGLVTRRVSMLPLRKVTDMTYRRSLLGRLFGYGEFVMESAGEAQTLKTVSYLPSPDVLYLEVSELLFAPRERTVAPAQSLEY